MTHLFTLQSKQATERYRFTMTGEKIGWVIFKSPHTFQPVHRILSDPERGPVIIVGTDVFEIDIDTPNVYTTEVQAREAYFSQSETPATDGVQNGEA